MEPLEKARLVQREKQVAGGSNIETNPVAKWIKSDKKSRVKAINAFCATCMGCEKEWIEPGFRSMIKKCTATECPLFVFRPYREK